MTIEIKGVPQQNVTSTTENAKSQKSNTPTLNNTPAHAETKTTQDAVSLSQSAQAIQEKLDATPEVNIEKVAALKKAISEGTYQVDTNKVAEKLLDLEERINKLEAGND